MHNIRVSNAYAMQRHSDIGAGTRYKDIVMCDIIPWTQGPELETVYYHAVGSGDKKLRYIENIPASEPAVN